MSTGKRVSPRHLARQVAVQTLYWVHSQPWDPLPDIVHELGQEIGLGPKAQRHALTLCRAAEDRRSDYEQAVSAASLNWDTDRIGRLERIIIRLALAEWDLEQADTPPKVVLNEAISLAREFCGDDAAKFVNGILDRLGHERELLGSAADAS